MPAAPDLSRLRPARAVGRVVVSGLGPRGFAAGKTAPDFFFPPFVFELARNGIETVLAATRRELERACDTALELAIIHVYNEDYDEFGELADFDRRMPEALIFNRAEIGHVLGWKDRSREWLTARGVPMPRAVDVLEPGTAIFSNEMRESGATVSLLRDGDPFDPARFNAEFIDTRRTYRGIEYYTTLRLMCVGREIVAALVRASPVSEGSPSVRSEVTPLDPELLIHLYDKLIAGRRSRLVDLAARLGDALGPGFYAHDLLVERGSERVLLCESGFKFDQVEVRRNLHPIAAHLPESDLIFSPAQPARSAAAFLAECRRLGRFLGRAPAESAPACGQAPEIVSPGGGTPLASGRPRW